MKNNSRVNDSIAIKRLKKTAQLRNLAKKLAQCGIIVRKPKR